MNQWSLHRGPASGLVGTAMAIVSTSVALTPATRADDADERSSVLEEMRSLMRRTTVHVRAEDADEPHVTQLVDQALIRYVEDDRLIADSTFWLWTHNGRPVAAQKIEVNEQTGGNWTYCFASLCSEKITVKWPNVSGAFETEVGVTNEPIPDAPAPLANQSLRTQQLRALARQFTTTTDQGPQRKFLQELRLLPRPIFEYETSDEALTVQGAIFGFASGTNPDVLVVIELREPADGEPSWAYAPIRMTSAGVVVNRNDEPVYSTEGQWPRRQFPTWMYAFVPRAGN